MRYKEINEAISIASMRSQLQDFVHPTILELAKTLDRLDHTDPYQAADIVAQELNQLFAKTRFHIHFQIGDEIPTPNRVSQAGVDLETKNIMVLLDPKSTLYGPLSLLDYPEGYMRALCSNISHEIMHLLQMENSNNKMRVSYDPNNFTDEEYLSDKAEIQAKAKDAVEDLLQYEDMQDPSHILDYIKRNFDLVVKDSDVMWEYWNNFGKHKGDTQAQKVWNRFLKYVYFYANDTDQEVSD